MSDKVPAQEPPKPPVQTAVPSEPVHSSQPAATNQIHHTVNNITITSGKSVLAAFLLAFFFGPLGLFYASIVGGIVMLLISFAVAILTLGLGLIVPWVICLAWAVIATNSYNAKLQQRVAVRA